MGQLFFREGTKVFERKNGWARVTKYYDASCRGGRSDYVDSGNSSCTASNGIVNGEFAEWVSLKFLSTSIPGDPGANATGIEKAVSGSDDFRRHKSAFVRAAEQLIARGKCSLKDFENAGGWVASQRDKSRPIYFVYCGELKRSNRIYLDAASGRIFQ